MDDQLDDDLKKRIREVFDDFEDASADEGWLLLREKFPEKAKRRPIAWLWWGSVAASLLVFIGVLLFKTKTVDNQLLAGNKKPSFGISTPKTIEPPKDNTRNDSAVIAKQDQAIADNTASRKEATPEKTINKTYADNTATGKRAPAEKVAKKTYADNAIAANKVSVNKDHKQNKQITPILPGKQGSIVDNISKNSNPSNQLVAVVPPKSDAQKPATGNTNGNTNGVIASAQSKINDQSLASLGANNRAKADSGNKQQPVKAIAAIPSPGVNMMEQTKKPVKTLFEDDNVPLKPAEKTNDDRMVRFGVYAATYFNYAKGSSNQLNVGAGVTSDIRLSNNLKLSTGITIAQNSLSYQNQPPLTAAASIAEPVALLTASYANQSIYTTASPSFKNYNASLVGLDVPLNLKYEFNPQKSDTYILAGLSSGTFINESYTYSYTNPAPFSANVSQVQDQSTRQSFNSFYFAKTLNLAFGTGYALGGNRLVIEPFLKYPLDGLGSQQIKFGAGGLNLKFNFSK